MIRPMVVRIGWLLIALVAPLGCGSDGDNAGEAVSSAAGAVSSAAETVVQETPKTITVDLAEENESGQSGTATLTPNDDGTFEVAIELSPGGDAPQPAHIHEGTCPDVGDVAIALNDVVDGTSTTQNVDFSLEDVLRTDSPGYAINVHKSAAESDVYVACGDITDVSVP
jgi:CHRD domain